MSADDRRARGLMALGVLAGIAMTAWGILADAPSVLPADAVAVVNGQAIGIVELDAYASAREMRGAPSEDAERRRALERLIDEELLLQRGIELGLARHEPAARRAIVGLVISSFASGESVEPPDQAALRALYVEHQATLRGVDRVRLDAALVPVGELGEAAAYRTALEIAKSGGSVASEALAPLQDVMGIDVALGESGAIVGLDVLSAQVGAKAAKRADELAVGGVGDPVRIPAGWLVLALRERLPGAPLPFEAVVDELRALHVRSEREASLERYLEALRAAAEIEIADPLPTGTSR